MKIFPLIIACLFIYQAHCDEQESELELVTRKNSRLGYGLFYDYWDFNARYSSENGARQMSQSGDISGNLHGVSMQIFELSDAEYPIFFEISYRTGELDGLVTTTGSSTYVAGSSTSRDELEGKIGARVRSGAIDVNMSVGCLFIHSETMQQPRGLSIGTVNSSFSSQTYMGSVGLDMICDRNRGQFSYGLRWDNQLLLGLYDPDFDDPSFVWGYDTRATLFASYLVELKESDLTFMIKGGAMARDYFGQEASYSDASQVYGLYFRAGVGLAF